MSFKTFTLEISATTKCSLRCPYCYISFTNQDLTPETFDEKFPEVLELMKRSNTTELNCSFFGGEPMMNWPLIEHVTKKLRTEYPDIVKSLVIITNMTEIDQEKVDFIKKWGLGVSWSFDGITTSFSRPLAPDKKELYETSMKLYEDKMPLIKQLTNSCKTMIFPGNAKDMVENYEFFLKHDIPSPDFTIVRDDIWTKQDIIDFRNSCRDLADRYIEEVKKGTHTNIGFFGLHILDAIFGYTYGKRPFSCFAGTHGAVLMHDGEFYPCARFAAKKLMKIDKDFSFSYYQDVLNPQKFDKCQSCDMYQVCNTGCSFSQIANGNKPLDSVCELFHIIEHESHRIVRELKDDKTFSKILKNLIRNVG